MILDGLIRTALIHPFAPLCHVPPKMTADEIGCIIDIKKYAMCGIL